MLLLAAGCAEAPEGLSLHGSTMGTTYSVQIPVPSPTLTSTALQARIDTALEAVNASMSTYRPDSELSRFNTNASTDWVEVSPALAALVARAQRIAQLSGGAFDITVGPLVNLWGFGPTPGGAQPIPDPVAIAEVQTRIGFARLEVRQDPPALRKARPDLQVDLSAIAKGHGVDEVARRLDEAGITAYLVEIGGELRARGTKPDGRPWRIAIETPAAGARQVQRIIALQDAALATSGDYRNFIEIDGQRFSHVMDPRVGAPIAHHLAAVSVIAEDCALADAWATALLVLGAEEGVALAREQDLAALFILRDGEGWREVVTPAFAARLAAAPIQ